jgi:SpoVK/Ycf46/Vps4 family AAA+-type ATPase
LDHFKIIQKMERERGKVILLGEDEMDLLVSKTRGYSGADIKNLCTEVATIMI